MGKNFFQSHLIKMVMVFALAACGGQPSEEEFGSPTPTPTPTPTASLTISDGPIYDYGSLAVNSSQDHIFTVTNSGGESASSILASGLAAPYAFKDGTYPGTGGDCGTTLAAGATCSLVVTYAPTTSGTFNDTLLLDYNDGATAQQTSRDITGSTTALAFLNISDGPTYDYGSITINTSLDHTFTVTNTGGSLASAIVASGLAAPYTFKDGAYPGTGGDCGTTLAIGATCSIVVTFSPTVSGTFNDTLVLDYNDSLAAQQASRDITGVGATPASLSISDDPIYDYGSLTLNTSADHTFVITNTGESSAGSIVASGLAAPYTFKDGTYPGTGGDCGTTLAGGATCNIVVTFSPTVSGTFNDTLILDYNDGAAAQQTSRDITGIGASPASLSISDGPTYDYGSVAVNANLDHTFTVTNSGTSTASAILASGLAAPYTFKDGTYPGTGGDCGTTLAGGATCSIVVTFSPTSSGTFNDTLILDYNDGAAAQQTSRDISGSATALAVLTISDGPTYDYGSLAVGFSQDHTFTVTNSGSGSASSILASGLAAPYTFKDGTYPGTGGDCGTTLAAGATCSLVVTYAPTTSGTFNDTLFLDYNDGAAAQQTSRDITGSTTALAFLNISDAPTYDYGTVTISTSLDHTFTITNTGGASASAIVASGLAAPYTFKDGTYPGTGGDCGTTLAIGATCSIVVTFSPTVSGTFNDTLVLDYNDSVAAQQTSRDITGIGATPASLSISDDPIYDYGNVTVSASSDHTFIITNSGESSASSMMASGLAAPYTFKDGTYPGTGGNCGTAVAGGATCSIVVTFSPTSSGTFNDTLVLDYNDGASIQQTTRDITGTGVLLANLVISDDPTYNFGSVFVNSSSDHTFTVTNSGDLPASSMVASGLASPFTFKDGTYPGTGGDCGTSLAAGATCSIVVTFSPTSSGIFNDTLLIDYNDSAAAQQTSRDITGIGATPASLSISDGPTYDYGSVALTTSVDHTFIITNSGDTTASSMNGSGLATPYTFKDGSYPGTGGDCGTTLAAGATCSIVVAFSPTVSGTFNDTLLLDYNDGLAAQQASRDITGVGAPLASLSISDGLTYDYGSQSVSSTTSKSFTITNNGTLDATQIAASGLASPYYFPGGYPGTGGDCGTTLTASATCTIVVSFSPSSTGTFNDTILIDYDNGASIRQATRDITGTGALLANLTISDGPSYDYGSVELNAVKEHHFTISNVGGADATGMSGGALSSPFRYKGGTYPGTGGTCGTLLSFGSDCSIVVEFAPTTSGTYSDTLSIDYNNGVNSMQATRDMTGSAFNIFAEDNTVTTALNTGVAITLNATGAGGPFNYSIIVNPDNGSISGTPPNITYTPDASFSGVDYFTFQADDGANTSNIATVKVYVNPRALFITKSVPVANGDIDFQNILTNLGFNITNRDHDSELPSDAYGKDLIVVSSTVNPNKVSATFREAQVPFITWESAIYDDMSMSDGMGQGFLNNETQIQILDNTHPIASAFSLGNLTIFSATRSLSTQAVANLNANAQVVASTTASATDATIFTYESQVEMAGSFLAPARRVGFFAQDDSMSALNINGEDLTNATVDWAMSGITSKFEDNFQRANSATLGSASYGSTWTESETSGTADIQSAALTFNPMDENNLPLVKNTFSRQSSGVITWTFYFNWARSGTDSDYAVWMQLGQGDLMIDSSPDDSGVAVNLKWGGPSEGLTSHEGFGYVLNSSTTEIATSSGANSFIQVTVDLDAQTYDVSVDGTSVTNIAFENNVNIDTIRIFTDKVNGSDFSSKEIDNIRIFQGQ